MTAERTAEEWGRVAVSLPGWRWMPGMRAMGVAFPRPGKPDYTIPPCRVIQHDEACGTAVDQVEGYQTPDPDDAATSGALLALLGPGVVTASGPDGSRVGVEGKSFGAGVSGRVFGSLEDTIGRACIAAAGALGRWPEEVTE